MTLDCLLVAEPCMADHVTRPRRASNPVARTLHEYASDTNTGSTTETASSGDNEVDYAVTDRVVRQLFASGRDGVHSPLDGVLPLHGPSEVDMALLLLRVRQDREVAHVRRSHGESGSPEERLAFLGPRLVLEEQRMSSYVPVEHRLHVNSVTVLSPTGDERTGNYAYALRLHLEIRQEEGPGPEG